MTGFYIYAVTFDQEVFGVYATQTEAEASLDRQIADGGPAWEDCRIKRWRVDGQPELAQRGGVVDKSMPG